MVGMKVRAILESQTKKTYLTMIDKTKLRVHLINISERHKYNVLIVSGFNSYLYAWEELIETLSKYALNIYFLETREKDTSIVASMDFTLNRYCQDIIETMELLDLQERRTFVVGSSIGSSALVKLLAEGKLHPPFAFLVSPLPYIPFPKISIWYSLFVPPKVHEKVTKPLSKFFSLFFAWPDTRQHKYALHGINRLNWEKFSLLVKCIKDFNILDASLEKINSPVVIIAAKKDKGHPIKHVKKLAKRIVNAELIEVKYNSESVGSGLWKVIREKLKEFNIITRA